MHGYHHRVLEVDLSSGKADRRELPDGLLCEYIGGVGLGVRLLRNAPDDPLVVSTGPWTGAGLLSSEKCAFLGRSPLTGLLGESLLGGDFGTVLKATGNDALVLTGAAADLSVLIVDEQQRDIRPAPDLAGLSAAATEARLRQSLGADWRIAAIGPAGENGVRYAAVSHSGRHAGRTGMGAVMGAKNLKAIAVRGNLACSVADPEGLRAALEELRSAADGPRMERYREQGTARRLPELAARGLLPVRNFQGGEYRPAGKLAEIGRPQPDGLMLQYESLFALGPLLGLEDPDTVRKAVKLCDKLGLDTLSAGGTLAWAMESVDRGALAADQLDGIDLRFGNGEAALAALQLIGSRQGALGNLLAEGSRLAARRVGGDSENWAMQVKGLELPGFDPRGMKTLALALAVGARGGCHNRANVHDADLSEDTPDSIAARVRLLIEGENQAAVMDSLPICKFLRRAIDDFWPTGAHLLALITGEKVSADDLRRSGAAILDEQKRYNQSAGWTRTLDALPPRLYNDQTGLSRQELVLLLDQYYRQRGWSEEGKL